MKRTGVMLLILCCLWGCTGAQDEIDRGITLRSKILQASLCSFDAEITADYGETIYTFTMHCVADGAGDMGFTVTSPETIAGITGTIVKDEGLLTFDDTALYFDLMADEQLTPVSAPWIFLKTLRSGYLTAAGTEDGMLRLTIDDSFDDDALKLDIWLNGEDIPTQAEILYDQRRILSLQIKNFILS